jgi:hypothetical protein
MLLTDGVNRHITFNDTAKERKVPMGSVMIFAGDQEVNLDIFSHLFAKNSIMVCFNCLHQEIKYVVMNYVNL